jgi:ABC-type phosphate transport system substrate-binding protein
MTKTRKSLLVLLVAGLLAALAGGCGSSSSTSTSTTARTTPTAPTSSTTSAASYPAAAQAVAKCKAVVNRRAPANLKSKLIAICDKAGSRNAAGLKQTLGQVCTQIVKSSVPSVAPKSLKDEALTECKKAFALG